MELPLVKSARVLKLYPDNLVIAIEEREPYALWQRDGKVAVIAADGTVIDELNDDRFLGLPFVVGEGAEKRLLEYDALRAGLGDLATRVKAGVLVSGRRWSLLTTNGVEIKLPERDPGAAHRHAAAYSAKPAFSTRTFCRSTCAHRDASRFD